MLGRQYTNVTITNDSILIFSVTMCWGFKDADMTTFSGEMAAET